MQKYTFSSFPSNQKLIQPPMSNFKSSHIWFKEGKQKKDLGNHQEAYSAFENATTLNPNYCDAWYQLGKLQAYNFDNSNASLYSFEKALNLAKASDFRKKILNNQGYALSNLGNHEQAIAAYQEALQIDNKFWQAWKGWGWVLFNACKDYDAALQIWNTGLSKITEQDLHNSYYKAGYGELYYSKGRAQYKHGKRQLIPSIYWQEARASYEEALKIFTLQVDAYRHLEILQDLLQIFLGLELIPEAKEIQRRGSDLLERLLQTTDNSEQERSLNLKSAGFNQLTVDMLVRSQEIVYALETAELGKNTCLKWLLWSHNIPSPSYFEIRKVIGPSTACVYWHLSPCALTTFIILPNIPAPISILPSKQSPLEALPLNPEQFDDQRSASLQQLLAWEDWLLDWNLQYQNYSFPKTQDGKSKNSSNQRKHPWRTEMSMRLTNLKSILNIAQVKEELQKHQIENLILIPHRDLHRFPLHIFFDEFSCTYLPSVSLGLSKQSSISGSVSLDSVVLVENPKSTPLVRGGSYSLSPLPFAEVEAALVSNSFENCKSLEGKSATLEQIQQVLTEPHQVFHFTGHAAYNSANPAQSCLFLSGIDQLTLHEIIQLDLNHYQLVCLAACETAITGNQTITTEYVGLVSAFLKAQASYVISALWKVESGATTILVTQFYQALHTQQPPQVALKIAQSFLCNATRTDLIEWIDAAISKLPKALKLLLEAERERVVEGPDEQPYAHPYYWAAFTISGL